MSRDHAWFNGLYDRHQRDVHAYCLRRAGNSDAQDVVAQIFAVAWRRRDDVPEGDRALPWLYGVARRVLSHRWRSDRRARRLAEKAGVLRDVPPPGPDAVVVGRSEHQRVREAVAQLRPNDREVLLLSAWEGLTHAQIGEALGCSHAAIDKRVVRAKARLAEKYEALSRSAGGKPRLQDLPASAQRGGGAV